MSSPSTSQGEWCRVTRACPCTICGKPKYCGFTADGRVIRCMRGGDAPSGWTFKRADAEGGHIYVLAENGTPVARPRRRQRRHLPQIDYAELAERCRQQISDEQKQDLAHRVPCTVDVLDDLLVGWATRADLDRMGAGFDGEGPRPDGAFTIPTRSADMRIVGMDLRTIDDRKGAPSSDSGAKRGLIMPVDTSAYEGVVMSVEGFTDVAACLTVQQAAVGRSSASAGAELLAEALRAHKDVLVVGERDQHADGKWPGRDGARHVAQRIAKEWGKSVRWTLSPEPHKDVRDWLQCRVRMGLDLADPDALRAAGVELAAEVSDAEQPAEPQEDTIATGDNDDGERKPRKSQATLAVELAQDGVTLFHTPGGHDSEGYATITIGGHVETWRINSKGFRRYLARLFYDQTGKTIGSQAIQDAMNVLAGQAIYEGAEQDVHIRLAEHAGTTYLDLADADWRVVEITASGWRIIESHLCPVRFVRKRGMLPLPAPEAGGSVDELRELVNVPDDDDWQLVVAWLVAALRATGPYPVLAVNGEQGSAKSSLCRMLRALVDPNYSPLRRPPKEERDLMIAASNGWVVGYDNLSGIAPSLSDALCCLATGGGFATRELYSDDDEKLFVAQRPVMLNGIDEIATRPDLLDRALSITLPTIPEDRRRDESELDRHFEATRPRIIGALLDAVSTALGTVGTVKLDRLPRMADFAKWVTAAEPALGWSEGSFLDAYTGNRQQATETAIESAAVGPALMGLMQARSGWTGTAGELLAEIETNHSDEAQRRRKGWPGSAKAMSNAVRRLAPNLRQVGIEVSFDREPGGDRRRILILEWSRTAPPPPSPPSQDGDESVIGETETGRARNGTTMTGTVDRPREIGDESVTRGIRDGRDGRDGRFPVHTENADESEATWTA